MKTVVGKKVKFEEDITQDKIFDLNYPFQSWSIQVTPESGKNCDIQISNDNVNYKSIYSALPTATDIQFINGPIGFIKVKMGTSSVVSVSIRGC